MNSSDAKVIRLRTSGPPPSEEAAGAEHAVADCRAVQEALATVRGEVPPRLLDAMGIAEADELTDRVENLLVRRCRGENVPVEALGVRTGRPLGTFVDLVAAQVVRAWERDPDGSEPALVLRALALLRELRMEASVGTPHPWLNLPPEVDRFELMGEMAHDFRSPLTSILFLAETLRNGRSGAVTELQQSQLGLIYSAALGLLGFASDIMDLARSRTDPLGEVEVPFSVSEVLEGVVELVRPMAEEKGIDLVVVAPGQDRYIGRPMALSRAILNLTTNALKFTESGFVRVQVANVHRGEVEVSVRDSGPGISPEDMEKLFDPFRKPEYRKETEFSPGGLGLSIVRHVVESMGSELKLETRAGWGTRFSFRLSMRPDTDL